MKRTNIKALAIMLIATIVSITASAQIPEGYYDALKGKKGAELKTAVHNIIKEARVLSYGKGIAATWWGFYLTDNDNGYVIDRYSPNKVEFGAWGESCRSMNIEHSFPKSWWGGEQRQAYKDLYNLMPSDAKANTTKSNYGMGVVTKATYDNGVIKVGSGNSGTKMWQPYPEWQGDFARAYLYMATCYQDYKWVKEGLKSLETGDYPTLQKWASDLYIKWAKEDPVSDLEAKRNNIVYSIQGNRNPFIDFPNLMEYIWGDSINYEFDPAKTVTTKVEMGDESRMCIYLANFKTSDGGCTIETPLYPKEGVEVWELTKSYGWKGTGAIKEGTNTYATKFAAESSVVTPEIDLSEYKSATMTFSHAVNYAKKPSEKLSVEVRCEGKTTKLEGFAWPEGKDWTFINSGDIDLSTWAGKKINIVFHYTSTTSEAPTWQVRDMAIIGVKGQPTTAIGNVTAGTQGKFNPTLPYTVYDLSGRVVAGDAQHGVFIVKQGNNTFKVMR